MTSMESSVVATVVDARRVDKLGELYDIAVELVRRRLKGEAVPSDQVDLARVVVAQWAKVRQTDNARAALDFMMSRQLAENRQELMRYVEVTSPRSAIVTALPRERES